VSIVEELKDEEVWSFYCFKLKSSQVLYTIEKLMRVLKMKFIKWKRRRGEMNIRLKTLYAKNHDSSHFSPYLFNVPLPVVVVYNISFHFSILPLALSSVYLQLFSQCIRISSLFPLNMSWEFLLKLVKMKSIEIGKS